ncbi:hypothetical protein T440DRAFT_480130 [Plenodomus tracheiphilus IPT5]|uniref:Uncharacterized protein n=1 Tax=Plenodomus tracheiphilus IPT5 TaxID=1408161 RepID=A0A6A7B1U3_9PLEO|nr:hypothetical protein T440DRAFT_480130 [Plenodomus tracheiphilus IPT5]
MPMHSAPCDSIFGFATAAPEHVRPVLALERAVVQSRGGHARWLRPVPQYVSRQGQMPVDLSGLRNGDAVRAGAAVAPCAAKTVFIGRACPPSSPGGLVEHSTFQPSASPRLPTQPDPGTGSAPLRLGHKATMPRCHAATLPRSSCRTPADISPALIGAQPQSCPFGLPADRRPRARHADRQSSVLLNMTTCTSTQSDEPTMPPPEFAVCLPRGFKANLDVLETLAAPSQAHGRTPSTSGTAATGQVASMLQACFVHSRLTHPVAHPPLCPHRAPRFGVNSHCAITY